MSTLLSKMPLLVAAMAAGMLSAGCAAGHRGVFHPTEQATAVERGQIAARYPVPPEAPRGDVRIASMGLAKVRDEQGHKKLAIRVRMVVSNDGGAAPWSVSPAAVLLDHPTAGTIAPARMEAATGDDGLVAIARGQAREVDLYYHLPGAEHPADLHRFDVLWTVDTDVRPVSERTPFEKVEEHHRRPTAGYLGVGPVGWYGVGGYYGPTPWHHRSTVVVTNPSVQGPLVRPFTAPLPRIPAVPRMGGPRGR